MKDIINASPFLLVFIVFLILKLVGVIDWSWWWVTCPLWGPMALALALAIAIMMIWGMFIIILTIFQVYKD